MGEIVTFVPGVIARAPTLVVIGGGDVGERYVRQLLRALAAGRLETERIVVVDRDPECAARDHDDRRREQGEGELPAVNAGELPEGGRIQQPGRYHDDHAGQQQDRHQKEAERPGRAVRLRLRGCSRRRGSHVSR